MAFCLFFSLLHLLTSFSYSCMATFYTFFEFNCSLCFDDECSFFLQLIVGSRINLSSNCKCQLFNHHRAFFSIISIWMRNFLIAFLYPRGLRLLRGRSSRGGCRRGHPMVGRRSHLDVLLRRFLSGRAVVADYVISVSDLASVITGGRRFLRTLFHAFQRGRGRTRTCPTFPRKWAGPRFVF